ncbi:hypothetical protein K461DRAFT_267915 [Myriangium duriaei CBS 260.36]|uniref:Uncharacterized protein n=1 Tax=Myriangium duriaei CBS 260.36 TaxID=1168546 RepID=A0A9P4J0N8_9PEZI|nr:hypothetical protein K461DRAFT_267915 [Myriangium duriaei CBS 260.36]
MSVSSVDGNTSLRQCIETIISQGPAVTNQPPNDTAALVSAIKPIVDASRVPERRQELGHPDLFGSIVSIFVGVTPSADQHNIQADSLISLRLQVLRCLGNLLADNNQNRDLFIEHSGAFQSLKNCIIFESAGQDDTIYVQAATALKVAFNLCNEHAPAQVASLKAGLDRAILQHVHTSLFISKDDTVELALELLGDISSHLKDITEDIDFDQDFISQLLRLPCNEDVDPDLFVDMAAAFSLYLADSRFQEAILSANQIILAFNLLERTIFLLANSPKAEEGKTISSLLLRTLTSLSTLPAFPSSFPHNPLLITTLATRCILTESNTDTVLPAIAACILLGNYSTPSTAAPILSAIDLDSLYAFLSLKAYGRSRSSSSDEELADYLHSAAGMLRLLALHAPLDTAATRTAAVALLHFPHAEVQVSALRLLRQLVLADAAALVDGVSAGHATALGQVFASPEATDRLRLELARTLVAVLRSAATAATKGAVVQAFLGDAKVLDALTFAVGVKEMPLANAEGYLGLVLGGYCEAEAGYRRGGG